MTNQTMSILWQPDKTGKGVRILRVYGNHPQVTLPSTIQNLPVTEIGPYCFAAREAKVSGESFLEMVNPSDSTLSEAICGNFLQEVILPDTVTTLHNAAFYNCRKLHTISFGPGITSIGSDEFTNCRELKHLLIRALSQKANGLKTMLERIETDVYVHFLAPDSPHVIVESVLFFPEYYEWLDEVTPAHLFSRSINGEGYRMRKAFRDKIFDYDKYDQCFSNALATETDSSLCEIALWRLRYPVMLSEQARTLYHQALQERKIFIFKKLSKEKNTDLLSFIFTELELDISDFSSLLSLFGDADWAEGAAITMEEQHKKTSKRQKTFSFDFD